MSSGTREERMNAAGDMLYDTTLRLRVAIERYREKRCPKSIVVGLSAAVSVISAAARNLSQETISANHKSKPYDLESTREMREMITNTRRKPF